MSPDDEKRARFNVFKVWLSVLLNSAAMMAALPVVPLYVRERFSIEDPAEWALVSGLVYGAAPFAAAFAGPVWGALGDRFGRKWNLVRAQVAIIVCFGVFPLASAVWQLVLLRFLQGLCAGYVAPAFSLAIAPWPEEARSKLLSHLQIGMTIGLLLGPLMGAEVAVWLGRGRVFWLTSLFALAALSMTLLVREDRSLLKNGAGGARKGRVLDGWKLLFGCRVLALFLLSICVARFGISLVEPQLASFVRELGPIGWLGERGSLDRTVSLLFSVLAVGVLLFGTLWGRLGDRFGPVRVLGASGIVLGSSLLVMSLAGNSEMLLASRAVYAFAFAAFLPLSYAAISRLTPPDSISAAFALNQSAIQLAFGFGFSLGGVLYGLLTVRMLLVFAGLLGICAFSALPLIRAMHRREGARLASWTRSENGAPDRARQVEGAEAGGR